MDKRCFLRSALTATTAVMLDPKLMGQTATLRTGPVVQDESFWKAVRAQFRLTSDYINLENGFYCFQPEPVLDDFIRNVRFANIEASHYLRTRASDDKQRVRSKLAAFAGCSPEELVITRNTTESLDTVISGFDWNKGDEAVMANQDYGAMIDMFKLQARRHGIVNRFVDVPMDPKSDDDVIQIYANAFTPKTRLLMISHMVNITGHVLPVRAICDMAHSRGVPVMVDGAHTFAHLDFRIPDLHCDYFGASLHKWLASPLGAGVLYVKRDRIAALWPIYGDESVSDTDIRKLNHTGTHPVHTDLTIERSIAFHEMIGSARKEERLRYLQQYWSSQVRGLDRIVMNTPADPKRSCAIANVGVHGIPAGDLARILFDEHRIYTVAIDDAGVHGVRVTPQVYTSTAELDAFVSALKAIRGSM
jgi:selenocysteine lyase/cysteine desulfurase